MTATAEAFMTAENNNESELLTMFLERVVGAARGSEALDFEVKSAKGGLPKSLWETVSAFANTHGGWLLLGVRQEGQSLVIEGLPNAGSLLDDFFATLRNPSKINHSVCGVRDVGIEDINGKNIIAIRVPEAPRQQRPIHINDNPYTGTFVRRHTGDYRCTKAEVNRMIREASDVGADKTVLSDFTLHDIDQDALMRYRQLYQNRNIADPRNTYDTLRFLKSINAYGEERNSDKEGLTVAGLLLFGTEKAIRQWRGRHLIDFRIVSSEDKDQRWEDRVVWEGNLLSAFEAIYPRLIAGLATEFRLEGILRVDEGSVQTVLREAFVNLLVHTDYTIQEASLILRSGDGFRFRNPGNSRVSELDLFHGDRSDPRNPELVRMFRYIGLAEEAGTGIPKIIRAWRELGLEMPRIDVGTERYEFTLHLRQVHLISRQDRQWLRSLNEFWSEPEQLALVHAKNFGEVDNATVSQLSGLHPADVSKVLSNLRHNEYLAVVGGGRYTKYKLGQSAMPGPVLTKEGGSVNPEIWQQLLDIASPVRNRKGLRLEVVQEIIIKLCSITPLSARQIATLLNRRNLTDVRTRLLLGMVASGSLNFLYPDRPNAPNQKYYAPSTSN